MPREGPLEYGEGLSDFMAAVFMKVLGEGMAEMGPLLGRWVYYLAFLVPFAFPVWYKPQRLTGGYFCVSGLCNGYF